MNLHHLNIKKTAKNSVSIILVLIILLQMTIIGMPAASAADEQPQHTEIEQPVEETDVEEETIPPTQPIVYDDLVTTGDYTLTGKTDVGNLTIKGGTFNLNANDINVHGNITVTGGTLYINKGYLNGKGNFTMSGGTLKMVNVNDKVIVNGDFTWKNYSGSTLTSGVIDIKGNFTSSYSSFNPREEHKVVLSGTEPQTASFSTLGSQFNILELQNTSEEGIIADKPLVARQIIRNNTKISYMLFENFAKTLDKDTEVDADVYLYTDELNLNGHTLTVNGDFTHIGGNLNINGGKLVIKGDYRMQSYIDSQNQQGETVRSYDYSTGCLVMTQETDRLEVQGSFITASINDHTDLLTNGVMTLHGDFQQMTKQSSANFVGKANHKVILAGTKKQTINFAHTGASYSRFANLEITNKSAEGIAITNHAYVEKELTGAECTMTGYFSIGSSTTFTNNVFGGNIRVQQTHTLNSDLEIKGNLFLDSYDLKVNGKTLTVGSNVYIRNTYLSPDNGTLICEGNLELQYYGYAFSYLRMINDNDKVIVKGDFINNSYYVSEMTKGTLELKGDFYQNTTGYENNFIASGTHKTVFSGDKKQTINFASAKSYFNILDIQNTSEEGVVYTNVLNYKALTGDLSKLSSSKGEKLGWTLTKDEVYTGNLDLSAGTLDLNGYTLTVTGDLTQSGGIVDVNGGKLVVKGDYRMQSYTEDAQGVRSYDGSSGYLIMTKETDRLEVQGNFITASVNDHTNKLTNGVMTLYGDFQQMTKQSQTNFVGKANHKVILAGTKKQTINFAHTGASYSRFANLEITNKSAEGIAITNHAYVEKELTGAECTMTGYFSIGGNTTFTNNVFGGNIRVQQTYTLNSDLDIKGNLFLDSYDLKVNGKNLTVGSNVYIRNTYLSPDNGTLICEGNLELQYYGYAFSYLRMINDNDKVIVKGDFINNSYYVYEMTKGTLELKGDFYQNTTGYENNFIASGTHKTVFSGDKKQTINFASAKSYFNILDIQNTSKEGVICTKWLNYSELIDKNNKLVFEGSGQWGRKITEEKYIVDGDYYLAGGTLDLNGKTMEVNGDFIQGAGTVLINGGKLVVNGDYRMQTATVKDESITYSASNGTMVMTNEEDHVLIYGSFINWSNKNHTDKLTAGTFEVKGDIEISYKDSQYNFDAKSEHTLILSGDKRQTVYYQYPSNSKINHLQITNSEGVNFSNSIYVVGTLQDRSLKSKGTVYISSLDKVDGGKFSGNIYMTAANTLKANLEIGGWLYCNAKLNLGSHTVTANGLYTNSDLYMDDGSINCKANFNIQNYGRLYMSSSAASIFVGNDFIAESVYDCRGLLTDGTIEIKGDFSQSGSAYSFVCADNHTVILSGKAGTGGRLYIQTINFANPGSSTFANLKLCKSSSGYKFNCDIDTICTNLIEEIEDMEPPTKVTGVAATAVETTSVTLNWDAAVDNIGVSGYEIYRNNVKIMTTASLSFTDYNLAPEKNYIYTVYAFDQMRNLSQSSDAVSITTLKDTKAPETPQNFQIKSRTGSSITIGWTAAKDNVKTTGYRIFKDGMPYAVVENDLVYKDVNVKPGITYDYMVCAFDAAGNSSAFSLGITGNAAMPRITYVSPVDYAVIGGKSVSLQVRFADSGNSVGNKVKFQYANTKDNQWRDISKTLIGQDKYSNTELRASVDWDISKLPAGEYDIKVTLYDADNHTDERIVKYTIDTQAPNAPENIEAKSVNGIVNVTWSPSVSADCTKYIVYRAQQGSSDFRAVKTITNKNTVLFADSAVVPGETYTYIVTALDQFNNESARGAGVTVTVTDDEQPPKVESILPKDTRINAQTNITVKANDNIAVDTIKLQYKAASDDEWIDIEEKIAQNGSATFTFDTTKLKDGEYFVNAIAKDTNGNTSVDDFTKRFMVDNTGIAKMEITEVLSGSSYVSIKWKDVSESDFGYFLVEKKVDDHFVSVGKVTDTLGMHVKDLQPDTTYTFRVVGYDNLGNRGEPSDETSIKTSSDTTTPSISKFYPVSNAFNAKINLQITGVDNICAEKLKLRYSHDKNTWHNLAEVDAKGEKAEETFAYSFDVSQLPEGEIYIEAVVVDAAGNESQPIVNTYKVDRTAPKKTSDLFAKNEAGYISLLWTTTADDIQYFTIYRADEEVGLYDVLVKKCTTANYYDTNVLYNKIYSYKITATDLAGNTSVLSDEAIAQALQDTEAPVILGMGPKEKSTVKNNPGINIAARDNSKIDYLKLEYKYNSARDEIWTLSKKIEVDNAYVCKDYTWNTSDLIEGAYTLKVIAVDTVGNESAPYMIEYTLDKTAPKAPVLALTQENWQMKLDWDNADCEDFSYYRVYRRSEHEQDFKKLTDVKTNTYTDKTVDAKVNYFYKVEAYDQCGNFSVSNTQSGFAYDEDTSKPTAVAPKLLVGTAGRELSLDGTASKDNVRVTKYQWDMGNGDIIYGPRPVYVYETAGKYKITLTVSDMAGNTDSAQLDVEIMNPSKFGNTIVKVADTSNNPIPFAQVYLYMKDGENKLLQTDSNGYVNIAAEFGEQRIAVYQQGYLPVDTKIVIDSVDETKTVTVNLESGELVTGELSVHKMELTEMIEAGIDFSNPQNYNSFVFTVDLTFAKEPIPTRIEYVYLGSGTGYISGSSGGSIGGSGSGGSGGSGFGGGSIQFTPVKPKGEAGVHQPILAYISTQEGISWLKDMYTVNLGVINNAASSFVIESSIATLDLPSGLSLAETINGQSLTQDMGDIFGQQQKQVSWYIKGDEAGEYTLEANFNGTLMPFEQDVNATFITENPFVVEMGKGIHIYIYPESSAYIGETYYIQYEVVNESSRPFYNLNTTFGPYVEPQEKTVIKITDPETGEVTTQESGGGAAYVIDGADQSLLIPVLQGGDSIKVKALMPGDSIRGTYQTTFSAQGNPEKDYYRLIKSVAKELGESNTGVELHISPIPSHITKFNVKYEFVNSLWADPVDMSTGAFTDKITAMSVNGDMPLAVDLKYNSLEAEKKGELGYGWSHDYETYLEVNQGMLNLHWSATNYTTFVTEEAVKKNVSGKVIDGSIVLSEPKNLDQVINYLPVNTGMDDYNIARQISGEYILTTPGGTVYTFNSNGKLIHITEADGRALEFIRTANSTIIREEATGKSVTLHYNKDGLITSLSDSSGRQTGITYVNNCITGITNPLGQKITYSYDEKNRIVSAKNNEGVTYVKNTYDEKNRVLTQDDADSSTPLTTFSYEEDETTGCLKVTGTDRNAGTVVYESDNMGHVTKVTDQNNVSVYYGYDSKGNKISEKDGCGNTTNYTYDYASNPRGNLVKIRDAQGNTTSMTYDSKGNITKVTGPDGKENHYTYNVANLPLTEKEHSGANTTYTYNQQSQITSETQLGRGTKYYNYTNGMLSSTTDANGGTESYLYDKAGNVVQTTDRAGGKITRTYDLLNRVLCITDATKGSTTYTYDAAGNTTSETDANGNTITYIYNANNLLTKMTNAKGGVTLYEYDGEGRLTKRTNPDKTTVITVYDGVGNPISVTNEKGETTKYTYDGCGRILTITAPDNSILTNEYDADGKLKKVTNFDGSYDLYTYNAYKKLVSATDNLGNKTVNEYDKANNLIKVTDAENNATKYTYDIYGNMLTMTDANGNVSKFEYDANGNCIKKTNALGQESVLAYDTENRLVSVSQESGNTTYAISYGYDAQGRVTQYTDEEGNVFKTQYDLNGNVTEITDALGNTMTSTYDAANNVASSTDAEGTSTQYQYDIVGNLTETIENLNTEQQKKSTLSYDVLGRLTASLDAEGGKSTLSYDNVGNVKSVKDPNGGIYTYDYDQMGRVTKSVSPLGSVKNYKYNAVGLLEEAKNAKGQNTTYTYDKIGRINSMKDELGTVQYTYDGNGNVLTVTDSSGTITRKYDALNRVTEYTDYKGNTVKYAYDTLGNLIALTYPGGKIVRYAYYPTGRLKTVTDWDNRTTQFSYDGNGRATKVSRPDGSIETYTYDKVGRLTAQLDKKDDTVINAYTYTYNAAGNIIKTEASNGTIINNLTSVEMTYDEENRLVTYNGEQVQYDADGNMTYGPLDGSMTDFVYDCRNRLIKAGTTTYEYDAENNRTAVQTENKRTEYMINSVSSALTQILAATEYAVKNGVVAEDGKRTDYVYGNGLIAQQNDKSGYLLYHYNNIGSTTAVTDINGKLKGDFSYGPYGELLSCYNDDILFLYNGRYGVATDDNGLYHMRARYYNVEIKRFINQDILTGSVTDSPSLNRYAYCQGNPISLADPFGLSPTISWGGLGHAVLDVLGFIPVIGFVFDVANAIWYAAEGDWFGCITSAISAIPGVGDVIGGAAKVISGSTKIAKIIKYSTRIAAGAATFGRSVYAVAKESDKLVNHLQQNGGKLDAQAWSYIGGIALQSAVGVVSAKGLGSNISNLSSTVSSKAPTTILDTKGTSGRNINPNEIRYSQSSVNGSEGIIDSMKANGWKGDPIDVIQMPDGNYTTIDNTRVAAAREVGMEVQATVRNYNDPLPANMIDRFTTKKGIPTTWGDAIELRIGKQNSSFRNNNPMGSYHLQQMK